MTNTEYTNHEALIDAINYVHGHVYMDDNLRETEIDNITRTRDSIDDFKRNLKLEDSILTYAGILFIFTNKSQKLHVMDFGDYRLSLI